MKISYPSTVRRRKQLHATIADIDRTIRKVHRIKVDFAKGSIWQRLINDLDAARVTARAILHLEETPDVDTETHHPHKYPD